MTQPTWLAANGLPPGDADNVAFQLQSVTMKSGRVLAIPAGGVTAIVGANNSGKSTFLRQLNAHLTSPAGLQSEHIELVTGIHIQTTGTASDFVAWLGRHSAYRAPSRNDADGQFIRSDRGSLSPRAAFNTWGQTPGSLHPSVATFLVRFADAQSRLGQVGAVGQRADVADPPQNPLHSMQDDVTLRQRLSDISDRIFRTQLTLDALSGNMQLRLGVPKTPPPRLDESQVEYREALAALPLLSQQGDGMKSLIGLLLPLVTATYPLVIVDEPEAFLHPPQAYALGATLGELARESGLQVVLATHDRSLLAGLLNSGAPLSVVRLSRAADSTDASQLEPEVLSRLWSDPVMRYSNVLDGLFHQLVVIAEAERDCRFYGAAMDATDRAEELPIPPSDVLFVPSNGKDGMPAIAEALSSVAVPVVASPDLDLLNDEAKIQRLVSTLGGDWSSMKADYDVATSGFRQPRDPVRIDDVRRNIQVILDDAGDGEAVFGRDLRDRVQAATRVGRSPWQDLKDYGERAFKGQAAQAFERLRIELDKIGLVLVLVGELEEFAPSLGVSKGKAWLPAALEAGAHEGEPVRAHLRRVLRRA